MDRFTSWIKQNKVAAIAAAGIGFLFLAKKGGGGGGTADAIVVPTAVESANASEGAYEYRDQGDAADDFISGFEQGLELGRENPDADSQPEPDPGPEQGGGDSPPTPDRQGVTIMGHFFEGATGYTISRVDGQGWTEYLVKFQGRNERWQFHPSYGWTQGWRNPTASAPAPEPVPQPAPTVPVPTVPVPDGADTVVTPKPKPTPYSPVGEAEEYKDGLVTIPLAGGGVYRGPANGAEKAIRDAEAAYAKKEVAKYNRNRGKGKRPGK